MKKDRVCLKCRISQSFIEFTQKKHGKEYFHSRCRTCLSKTHLKCNKCENIRPLSKFYKTSSEKRGYAYQCKDCRHGRKVDLGKTFFEKNKDEIYAKRRERIKTDPIYKMANLLRTRLSLAIKRKKWNRISSFRKYIGCDLETLKSYIESKFKPGMTWENHTLKGWHIDHIVPLSSAKTVKELEKLCHYKNLQPLWYHENISKRAKIQS